jgi:RimJ/RimL family protein N-acetyltransferase
MIDRGGPKLFLDVFVPADALVLCEVDSDPEHRRRFGFLDDFVPSLRHSEEVIARWAEERRAGSRFPFAIRDAATGELVGGCELRPIGGDVANISFWTHPLHRGRGVGSEAVRQLCAFAFAELAFRRVELVADPDNVASRRVAVHNGFSECGVRAGRVMHILKSGE